MPTALHPVWYTSNLASQHPTCSIQAAALTAHASPARAGIIVTQLGYGVDTRITIQLEGQDSPPITVADYLETTFGFEYSFMGPVVGILLGFTVFFAGALWPHCLPPAAHLFVTAPCRHWDMRHG